MKERITTYREIGIPVAEFAENGGFPLTVGGETYHYDIAETAVAVTVIPSYRGNGGFLTVFNSSFTAVLIKGVYKDFIRILKGKADIPERSFSEISQSMTSIESAKAERVTAHFLVTEKAYLAAVSDADDTLTAGDDLRDFAIPRPLSQVEYSLGETDALKGDTLLSTGFFGALLPEICSPVMSSLTQPAADMLNGLFNAAELKTESPAVKRINHRIYANMKNLSDIMDALQCGSRFLYLHSAPYLIAENDRSKLAPVKLSFFPVFMEDIAQLEQDVATTTATLGEEQLISETLFQQMGQITIAGMYTFIQLQDKLSALFRMTGSMETALRLAYRCRGESLLTSGTLTIPPFIDPAFAPETVTLSISRQQEQAEDIVEKLPAFTKLLKKKKILRTVRELHEWLTLRDRITVTALKLSAKMREMLQQHGEKLVESRMLRQADQIFFAEFEELMQISQDKFHGNLGWTIGFRKWQHSRFAAQPMPPVLLEGDIRETPRRAEKLYDKAHEGSNVPAFSMMHTPLTLKAAAWKTGETLPQDALILTRAVPLAHIPQLAGAKGIVAEYASPLSYLAEYCVLTGTPLYAGVRFAPLLYDGCTVTTGEKSLSYTKGE